MKCPRCQHENRSQATFCEACGTPLTANPSGAPSPSYSEVTSALSEALEQRTATAEILRVISSSPTAVDAVFDAILQSAVRLCDGLFGVAYGFDGEHIHVMAHHNQTPEALEFLKMAFPAPADDTTMPGRGIRNRTVIHIVDAQAEETPPATRKLASKLGFRSVLAAPMLREERAVGSLVIARRERGPFCESEIELIRTFADQAVIAIENVRLFTELQEKNRALTEAHAQTTEALRQQTATAEILRAIASSPTTVDPVFDAILDSALRLCTLSVGNILLFDGAAFQLVAHRGVPGELIKAWQQPQRYGPHTGVTRAISERQPVQILDMMADRGYEECDPIRVQAVDILGGRTALFVPMLKEGTPVGVIVTWRREVRAFSHAQIQLLSTFADQAVIAIENVRLFTELQARTRELTRSVEELQALSAVSRTVSSTLDLPTVLTTIVDRAVQLSGAAGGVMYEYDEGTQEFQLQASRRMPEALVEVLRAAPIRPGEGATGQAALRGEPVQLPDIGDEQAYSASRIRTVLLGLRYRSVLAVPLVSEQRILGVLTVWRQAVGRFPDEVVNLLQTFASQSALAIQNARLFREIADKSRLLEAASRHKSEFLANMSHELRTPLNAILGFSEVLAERMFGEVNEKQAEYLQDILSSGRHLLSLINDILDLSKVEAGRLELEISRFHLPTALDDAVTLVRERATRHGITLTQAVDPAVGDIVADERKVKQILLNLLSNAVKFTPEGGRVRVAAALMADVITVEVNDTGIGIAPEDQAAIFEEFRQVGREDAREQEGTGLGLTLAKKFVELHGGRIWVQSEVSQGATFAFTLPVRLDDRSPSDQGEGAPH